MATQRAGSRTRKKQFVNKGRLNLRSRKGSKLDEPRDVNGVSYDRANRDGDRLYSVIDSYKDPGTPNKARADTINEVQYADYETVLQPDPKELRSDSTDQKNPAENVGERQKAAGRKRQGRGSLRISAKGNGGNSADRLKQGGSGRNKRSSGAQGGGRSGLNIPR